MPPIADPRVAAAAGVDLDAPAQDRVPGRVGGEVEAGAVEEGSDVVVVDDGGLPVTIRREGGGARGR